MGGSKKNKEEEKWNYCERKHHYGATTAIHFVFKRTISGY